MRSRFTRVNAIEKWRMTKLLELSPHTGSWQTDSRYPINPLSASNPLGLPPAGALVFIHSVAFLQYNQ